eukprot:6183215-Pleurochrysis_carterae.AAC.6
MKLHGQLPGTRQSCKRARVEERLDERRLEACPTLREARARWTLAFREELVEIKHSLVLASAQMRCEGIRLQQKQKHMPRSQTNHDMRPRQRKHLTDYWHTSKQSTKCEGCSLNVRKQERAVRIGRHSGKSCSVTVRRDLKTAKDESSLLEARCVQSQSTLRQQKSPEKLCPLCMPLLPQRVQLKRPNGEGTQKFARSRTSSDEHSFLTELQPYKYTMSDAHARQDVMLQSGAQQNHPRQIETCAISGMRSTLAASSIWTITQISSA